MSLMHVELCLQLAVSCRILHKTHQKRRENDKTIRHQLEKKNNQVAISAVISTFPSMILGAVKYLSPETPMVDPSANPVFFVLFLLSLNGEWRLYSLLISSMLRPISHGIHNRSGKK